MRYYFFIFFAFAILAPGRETASGFPAISKSLYCVLPPAIKPVNSQAPTADEIRMILISAGVDLKTTGIETELEAMSHALELYVDSIPDKREKVESAYAIAEYRFHKFKEYPQAIIAQQKVLNLIGSDTAFRRVKLAILTSYANLYRYTGDIEASIRMFHKALALVPEKGCKRQDYFVAHLYLSMAGTYIVLELYDEVILYAQKSKRLCDTVGGNQHYNDVFADLHCAKAYSLLFREKGDSRYRDSVITYSNRILRSTKDEIRWHTSVYAVLGRTAYWNKEYKLAITYLDSALLKKNVAADFLWNTQLAGIYRGLAEMHLTSGKQKRRYIQARYLNDSTISEEADQSYIYEDLFYEFQYQGEHKIASTYLDRFMKLKDSIDMERRHIAYYSIEAKYEEEKKEHLIRDLDNENKLAAKHKNIILLTGIVLVLALGLIIIALSYLHRARQKKQQERHRQLEAEKMEVAKGMLLLETRLLDDKFEALQAQRTLISEDMHSELGSSLAALRYYVADMNALVPDQQAKQILSQVEDEISGIYKQARDYIHALNKSDQELRYDIVQSLRFLAIHFNGKHTIKLRLAIDEDQLHRLPVHHNNEFYFIVKEAITNTLKHAQASEIILQVKFTHTTCHFLFSDNGIGFDPSNCISGLGVHNIRKRVEQLGGKVFFRTSGKGTVISGRFPIRPDELQCL